MLMPRQGRAARCRPRSLSLRNIYITVSGKEAASRNEPAHFYRRAADQPTRRALSKPPERAHARAYSERVGLDALRDNAPHERQW